MTKNPAQPTVGQLERELAQRIHALYRSQLNHQPTKVTCQLFDNKLTVVIENAITQPEKLLSDNGSRALVDQVRVRLNEIIQPQMQQLVEDTLQVSVVDVLSDMTINTGRGGLIVILDQVPNARNRPALSR